MKNELVKKGPAKPTGRRYSSVAELLKGEGASATSIKRVQALSAKTRVAQQLVQIRIREGLTQAELAKKIGCTQSRISKIESGHDEDITLGIIRDYVKATNGRISISCGKPMNHVEAVKAHGTGLDDGFTHPGCFDEYTGERRCLSTIRPMTKQETIRLILETYLPEQEGVRATVIKTLSAAGVI